MFAGTRPFDENPGGEEGVRQVVHARLGRVLHAARGPPVVDAALGERQQSFVSRRDRARDDEVPVAREAHRHVDALGETHVSAADEEAADRGLHGRGLRLRVERLHDPGHRGVNVDQLALDHRADRRLGRFLALLVVLQFLRARGVHQAAFRALQ
jgi:hypothetical protein